MSFTVNIKWGKEKFPDVEIDTNEPTEVLRAQLFALSGVPPERQKLMAKGKTLKDSFKGFPLKNKMTLMMMGSADALPETQDKVVFVEDMDQSDRNKVMKIPLGLNNLGNTCYMNSCIQTLRSCPVFLESMKNAGSPANLNDSPDQIAAELTSTISNVYHMLNTSNEEAVSPFLFWATLRKNYPQFGEMDPNSGGPMQHDANECWTLLMHSFQNKLKAVKAEKSSYSNLIDQQFAIKMESTIKCTETGENVNEPETKMQETELQLSCFLDKDVKYLMSGIKNKFSGEIEKRAESLDRNAVFSKTTKVTRLPAFLAVQMVRFFYKAGKNGAAGVNAKILKEIKFQKVIDLKEVCSDELSTKIQKGRDRFEQMDDWKREETLKTKAKGVKQIPEFENSFLESNSSFLEQSEGTFEDGDNCSGFYELYGVLTHKGRSSDSGHYVAWTRPDPMNDKWFLFDDENVSEVQESQVLDLSGGGDWHCSYVLLYGPRRIRKFNAENIVESSEQQSSSKPVDNDMKE